MSDNGQAPGDAFAFEPEIVRLTMQDNARFLDEIALLKVQLGASHDRVDRLITEITEKDRAGDELRKALRSRKNGKRTTAGPAPTLEDLVHLTAAELEKMDLPEPTFIVDGVLPEGSTLLVAKPKRGKSMLMQQTGLAIALGGKALGKIDVEQGRVLYLMLEGSLRGLKRRFKAMLGVGAFPPLFDIYKEWPAIDAGGADLLHQYVERHPDTRLIIVDTLKRISGRMERGASLYDYDYDRLHPFSALYEETGISSVVIHHANKRGNDEDVVDQVSGTTGLSGAVENVMVLARDGGRTLLKVRPREEEETDLALDFDPSLSQWTLLGDAEHVGKTQERQDILDVLAEAGEPLRPADIAALLGKTASNVNHLLLRMKMQGKVHQPSGRSRYALCHPHSDRSDRSESTGDTT